MPVPPFQFHASRAPLIALTLSLALSLTSPLAASSQTSPKPLPASVPVNLTVTLGADRSNIERPAPGGSEEPPLLVVTLHNIVVQQKAGPWGLRSYWHDYVISLAPGGGIPLVIEAATLVNARGEPVAPGDNPWVLANASKVWIERTDARGVTSPGRIAAASVAMGAFWPAAGGGAVISCLNWEAYAVGAAILTPVFAAKIIAFNVRGKKQIEADFQKRRLVLPLTITSGPVVQGSLFFPVTLKPQRLVLRCRVADQVRDLVLPLGSVADLSRPPPHRAASSKAVGPPPPPATPNPRAKP